MTPICWFSGENRLSPVKKSRRKRFRVKRLLDPVSHFGNNRLLFRYGLPIGAMLLLALVSGNVLLAVCYGLLVYMSRDTLKAYRTGRSKLTLLKQQLHMDELIRAKYYETGTADEAVYEACIELDASEWEIRGHGERIYDVLTSADMEKALFEYRESAPNRYLKLLLSLVYITREYGDTKVEGQSIFMKNLSYLSDEIRLEMAKREKLNHELKSLNAIVLVPLAAMWPVADYAGKRFEPLVAIYEGPTGYLLAGLTVAAVVVCYYLLRRLQKVDEGGGVRRRSRRLYREAAELEIHGLMAIVMMLMHHERMAVEDVVEWMEMYSEHAKEPLQRCLNEMTAGEEEALERLDAAVGLAEFSRLVGKLKQATMDLTLAQAFDEMERERRFFYEMRKELDQRQVERKMSMGKMIGFVPMYVMVLAYVAAPMLLVSFREMDTYFNTLT